jgi:hypothetical protein
MKGLLDKKQLSEPEERDREGYLRQPQSPDEIRLWEAEAVWPEVNEDKANTRL